MTKEHSSTSNFDQSERVKQVSVTSSTVKNKTIINSIKMSIFIIGWLALIDIAINILFPYPKQFGKKPSGFQQYFGYGRSIEGKLAGMVGESKQTSAPIIKAGWLEPQAWKTLPTKPEPGSDLLVATYGMSFANHASEALAEHDGRITLRLIAGPAAPPNHSFTAYLKDTEGRSAQVAIFGILASSVLRMRSITGMNWTYEHPAPYTYPRYSVNEAGELKLIEPVIATESGFREAFLAQDNTWDTFIEQLKESDYIFDPLIFNSNILDNSAIIRLLRRGWAKNIRKKGSENLYDPQEGFNPQAPEIKALKLMIEAFHQTTTDAGQVPVILLINDQGYQNHLYTTLIEHLQELDVPFVSTHTLAPATDPSNFIGDGHFTTEANRRIGQELSQVIRNAVATNDVVNTNID